jgi:putative ubiquitin-RnfH superfamily antitoxin RatB of RatAB toxin-antitoxin module
MFKIEDFFPDFEEMAKVNKELRELVLKKNLLELEIDIGVKDTVIKIMSTAGDKKPSMEFIKTTYLVTGLDDSLIGKREALVELNADLDYKKNEFFILKQKCDVYRTLSANQRYTDTA